MVICLQTRLCCQNKQGYCYLLDLANGECERKGGGVVMNGTLMSFGKCVCLQTWMEVCAWGAGVGGVVIDEL